VCWDKRHGRRRNRPRASSNSCPYYHSKSLVFWFLTQPLNTLTDWVPLQVAIRDGRFPDPNVDEIVAVFYAYQESNNHDETADAYQSGIVAVHNDRTDPKRLRDLPIETVDTELELLNRITDIIVEFDPDILAGWEIQTASWGYCDARGKTYGKTPIPRYLWVLRTL
jgi:hypothetical protein